MRIYRNGARARHAAALYLDQRVAVPALAERFGIPRSAIYAAIAKLRSERGASADGGRITV